MLPSLFSLSSLGGDFAALQKAVQEGRKASVFYTSSYARCHIAAGLGKFFLYVTPDRIAAKETAEILSDFAGGEVVWLPERDDVLLNAQTILTGALAARITAFTKIFTGEAKGAVVSAEGLLQYVPHPAHFKESLIVLKKDEETDLSTLSRRLTLGGYRREDAVTEAGSFSLRGGILDVFPVNSDLPVRVEFFGDTIESIRLFAPDSMLSVREIESFVISPKSDIIVPQNSVERILKRIDSLKRTSGEKMRELLSLAAEKVSGNPSDPSLQWLLPLMKEEFCPLPDALPAEAILIFDEIKAVDDKIRLYGNAHLIRVKSFTEAGEAADIHKESILPREALYERVRERTIVSFQQVTSSNPVFEPDVLFNIKSLPITKYSLHYQAMAQDIKGMLVNGARVFIYTGSADTAKAVSGFLFENDLGSVISPDGEGSGDILLIPKRMARGFIYPKNKLMLIGTDDLVRRTEAKKKSFLKKKQEFLVPVKGDYVVHERHGIGLSEGVVQIETKTGKRDYYVVLYKGGDRLYLPVDQMDSLEKYAGGGTPGLHKLGGKEFERVKERVKHAVKALAIDLLALYEKRLNLKGYKYQPDTFWQKEMEEAFEFTETDDQLTAIAEIKEDMESGKVMDRLLCGDVGFGKTEVAIRAIFKTVLEGKQAAVLCPTTILCQQHYNTIKTRLSSYGIKIDLLSRFMSKEYIAGALERIKKGETNIAVATHRLLSKDVVFKDLGLLVLDEEQRFGVEHKEKIKLLKTNVNVLALSATPIPRTLHMSLSGIRDISTLETPPHNRLPVETYVLEYSDALVKDAVRREVGRGGQIFILYNRVQTIEVFYRQIQELLAGEATVLYAHGQMESDQLEERIRAFYDKEADVLISTTIIENGIDIPGANTLIVVEADRLGLSELYQLRGRVGRSFQLAYAYFTVREGKVLTEDAMKRMDALLNYTELGSGFKVAMQDLEIRGAGNVLGREQHGNMEKVGYDMYCRLLTESIGELRGVMPEIRREVEIIVDGEASLPADYIPGGEQRVKFYKQVAALAAKDEEEELLHAIKDAYGPPPEGVVNLVGVGLIKNLAAAANVKKVIMTEEAAALHFYDSSIFKNEGVFRALGEFSKTSVLTPQDPPAVLFPAKGRNLSERIGGIKAFLLTASAPKG